MFILFSLYIALYFIGVISSFIFTLKALNLQSNIYKFNKIKDKIIFIILMSLCSWFSVLFILFDIKKFKENKFYI